MLQLTVDEVRKRNGSLYVCFLDLEKAFDRVDREKLLRRLNDMNANESIVKIIRRMYEKNQLKLTLGEIESKWVENDIGVSKGAQCHQCFSEYL